MFDRGRTVPQNKCVGRCGECDCAVRIVFDQDADRHWRRRGSKVGVVNVSNMSEGSLHSMAHAGYRNKVTVVEGKHVWCGHIQL